MHLNVTIISKSKLSFLNSKKLQLIDVALWPLQEVLRKVPLMLPKKKLKLATKINFIFQTTFWHYHYGIMSY
jgi:hypothetical protein